MMLEKIATYFTTTRIPVQSLECLCLHKWSTLFFNCIVIVDAAAGSLSSVGHSNIVLTVTQVHIQVFQ
jgi:hypothetical protein